LGEWLRIRKSISGVGAPMEQLAAPNETAKAEMIGGRRGLWSDTGSILKWKYDILHIFMAKL
jgi:hypothetical protein